MKARRIGLQPLGSLPHMESKRFCYRCYLLLRQLGASKKDAMDGARKCWEVAA